MAVKRTYLDDGSELREYDTGSAYAVLPDGRREWVRQGEWGKKVSKQPGFKSAVVDDAEDIISRFKAAGGGYGYSAPSGGTTGTTGTGSVAPSSGGGYSGGGGGYSGGDMGGGLVGQIADAYSQPLDFSSLPGLSGVSAPSQSVDFTDAFDPRFQNVNFLDPFDSRLQGVSFGGGTQGVDFSGGGPSVATLDWNEPSGNPGGSGGGKGGQAMAPPPMMQQPPMQQAPPMQGGGKGAGKGGAAAQPQPFGRLYG